MCCKSLKIVNLNKDVVEGAFCASGITTLTIGTNAEKIGASAFKDCTSLTSLTLGGNLKEIEPYAFSGCNSLTTISLPQTLEKIGAHAFDRCTNLRSVTYRGTTYTSKPALFNAFNLNGDIYVDRAAFDNTSLTPW